MNGKELLKTLRKDGWIEQPQGATSHIHLVHPKKKGKVTVALHGKKDIPIGTLNRILKQAGLK